ncbi:MAG TPA: M14 family metallocarboxypeptidase [Bacillota bacterium]|nr:M14 family metallocarboxypeptidase [Bacillota bacterium]
MEWEQTNNNRIAGGQNKHFSPYYKQTYFPPEKVMELYQTPNVTYQTPAFLKEEETFTTQEEMMDFLYGLTVNNDDVRLEIIAHSVEGREVPLLIFSTSHDDQDAFAAKPTVWLQAQVHGDEPAAGESALVIAKQLADGKLGDELLDQMNVLIVPRMNPDSMFYFQRNSAEGLNGNRDHINLEMTELQAIHETFNQYNPEVVIDAHEYGATPQFDDIGNEGALKYHDVLLQTGKNLNIPEEIRQISDEWFMKDAFAALEAENLSYGTYYTVAEAKGLQPTLHEGGVNAGTGRNTFGLKPSISILVETLGIGIGRANFLRRVFGQVTTHIAILKTVLAKGAAVKQFIKQAYEDISQAGNKGKANGSVVLKSKLVETNEQYLKVVDIAKGKVIEIPVAYYSATKSVATMKRKRPTAYILPPAYQAIVEKLKLHGITVERLADDQLLNVECFELVQREVINEGSHPTNKLTTNITSEERLFLAGSYFIRSAQARALLASLALEPESDASFFAHNFIPTYVSEELPVYRIINEIDFPLIRV